VKRVVALFRDPAYSPSRHLRNDRAILEGVLERLRRRGGWRVARITERTVAGGRLPDGDLYLNMCQGPAASEQIRALLPAGAPCLNAPEAVLACHRHRLVPRLQAARVPFPATVVLDTHTADPLHAVAGLPRGIGDPVWVKRGDVHAQRPDDVVAASWPDLSSALAAFAGRGIRRAAVQTHVPGPVVKFYSVRGGQFFYWYPAEGGTTAGLNAGCDGLQALAERAARALDLAVYGGDAVLTPNGPVLIDLNDWPSFAPVRAAAAAAIARYAHRYALERSPCSPL
jgi:glutathione synthase/RimK-type ligase-like ATP-grasp enzyme